MDLSYGITPHAECDNDRRGEQNMVAHPQRLFPKKISSPLNSAFFGLTQSREFLTEHPYRGTVASCVVSHCEKSELQAGFRIAQLSHLTVNVSFIHVIKL